MRELKRQLRRRKKTILIWLVILGALALTKTSKYCSANPSVDCAAIAWMLGIALFFMALLGAAWMVLRNRPPPSLPEHGFALHPELYHESIIRLWGRVEYVFPDTVAEHIKRKFIDLYRSMMGDTDPTGRYLHQRFLMSSPLLYPRHHLLVIHNIKFGKEPLKRGRWVEVQGEYLHTPGTQKSSFGSRSTFYGRLHYTHTPKGYLRTYRSRKALKKRDTEVWSPSRRS